MLDGAKLLLGYHPQGKTGCDQNSLAAFNDSIESHEAGKKAANLTASANAVKIKGDKGKP